MNCIEAFPLSNQPFSLLTLIDSIATGTVYLSFILLSYVGLCCFSVEIIVANMSRESVLFSASFPEVLTSSRLLSFISLVLIGIIMQCSYMGANFHSELDK